MPFRFLAVALVFGSLTVVVFLIAYRTPAKDSVSAKPLLPSGTSSPEGAAADLVRSYIHRDFELFNRTRHIRMCEGRDNPAKYYAAFLENATFTDGVNSFVAGTLPSPVSQIRDVSNAREVIESCKTDLIYVAYTGLEDRVVVDVSVVDAEGTRLNHVMIVEKYIGGVWYAVPALTAWHSRHASLAAGESVDTATQATR